MRQQASACREAKKAKLYKKGKVFIKFFLNIKQNTKIE